MTLQQWLAILGGAAGSLGSIITAFSLNSVIRELSIARKGIEITVEALASNSPKVPVFDGLDKRFDRAALWGNYLMWLGVLLWVDGFVLQAVSACIG